VRVILWQKEEALRNLEKRKFDSIVDILMLLRKAPLNDDESGTEKPSFFLMCGILVKNKSAIRLFKEGLPSE